MESAIGKIGVAADCSPSHGLAGPLTRSAAHNAFRHLQIMSYGISITSLSLPSRNPMAPSLCWLPTQCAERIDARCGTEPHLPARNLLLFKAKKVRQAGLRQEQAYDSSKFYRQSGTAGQH